MGIQSGGSWHIPQHRPGADEHRNMFPAERHQRNQDRRQQHQHYHHCCRSAHFAGLPEGVHRWRDRYATGEGLEVYLQSVRRPGTSSPLEVVSFPPSEDSLSHLTCADTAKIHYF
ncbi:hypothetical protein MRX96_039959 [Rhipicephalus microplus]